MRVVAHLSDLHFGRVDPAAAAGLLRDLRADPPHLAAISGDLVQNAQTSHFRAAQDFLSALPCPFLAVPGNHDIPRYNPFRRFVGDPFADYRRYVCDDLHPFFADDEIAVLGINTARAWIVDFSQGRINRRQLDDMRAAFAGQPPGVCRIVVAHHPLAPPAGAPGVRLVGRSAAAAQAMAAAGVDLTLTGHLHRSGAGDLADHHSGLTRPVATVQAATAASTRLRGEANAYHRLTVTADAVHGETRVWNGAAFAAGRRWRMTRHASPTT